MYCLICLTKWKINDIIGRKQYPMEMVGYVCSCGEELHDWNNNKLCDTCSDKKRLCAYCCKSLDKISNKEKKKLIKLINKSKKNIEKSINYKTKLNEKVNILNNKELNNYMNKYKDLLLDDLNHLIKEIDITKCL